MLCAERQAPPASICALLVSCPRRIAGLKTGESSVLVSGADFYSNPRPSPDGTKLAWVRSGPRACELLHAIQAVLCENTFARALQALCPYVSSQGCRLVQAQVLHSKKTGAAR